MLKKFAVILVCLLFAAAGYAAPCQNVGPESVGAVTVIPEKVYFANGVQNQANWEMYSGAFVDGTLANSADTEAEGDFAGITERAAVVWHHTDQTSQEVDGFLRDNGTAWTQNNDIARTDGNPARIACQGVAGQENNDLYMLGNECTPWAYASEYPSYGSGFGYSAQVASVQILMRTASGAPAKVTNVFDPTYGSWTTGAQTNQIRFGGTVRQLSNQNWLVVQEDKSGNLRNLIKPGSTGSIAAASIWTPAGVNVPNATGPAWPLKTPGLRPTAYDGIWSNVQGFNGGFAVAHEGASVTFWNNDGSWKGRFVADRRAAGEAWQPWPGGSALWNTSCATNGGNDEKLTGDVALNYVHVAGRGYDATGTNTNAGMFVTRVDATTFQTIGEGFASEGITATCDRCTCATDKDGNVFALWADTTNTGTRQLIGRFLDTDLNPMTDAFLVFNNSQVGPANVTGFGGYHPSCAMVRNPATSRLRVVCTQRSDSFAPSIGLDTNDHYAIVFEYGIVDVPDWILY